jgi:hypothetical protein
MIGLVEKCRSVYGINSRLYIYGDSTYIGAFGVMGPYQHAGGRHALPPDEHEFNVALSSVRIAIEHSFGHVAKQWGFTAFAKGLCKGISLVAAYFTIAILFSNYLTYFRENQTSEWFGVEPPSINEYQQ